MADQGPLQCRGRADDGRAHRSSRTRSLTRSGYCGRNISKINGGVIYAKSNTARSSAPGATLLTRYFRPPRAQNTPGICRDPPPVLPGVPPSQPRNRNGVASRMAPDMGGFACRNHPRASSSAASSAMRPSIGRVAHTPAFKIDRNLTGARNRWRAMYEDLALLLDAMSGENIRPIRCRLPFALAGLIPVRPARFRHETEKDRPYRPISASPQVDPEVRRHHPGKAALRLAEAGAIVEESASGTCREGA